MIYERYSALVCLFIHTLDRIAFPILYCYITPVYRWF